MWPLDYDAIERLEAALFPDNALDQYDLPREFAASIGLVVAAWPEGEIAGYAILRQATSPRGYSDLLRLGVDKDARRKGVGRALLAGALALAGPRVMLTVDPENVAAVALYRAAGFRAAGRLGRAVVLTRVTP